MKNLFTSDSILYYPTIEFQNDDWVKSTLTFWDKIYRIVPSGYVPKDTLTVRIAKDSGFIEDVSFSSDDLRQTAIDFEDYCEYLQFYPAGFDSSTYQIRLHSDKIDERLKPFFTQFSERMDSEGFYKLPGKIVNGYMFFLSDTISKRRNVPKITDNPDMFAAMAYFDGEGKYDELFMDTETSELYSSLIVENLLPANLADINMEQIIKLSEKLSTYKKEFRNCISTFSVVCQKYKTKILRLKKLKNSRKNYLK